MQFHTERLLIRDPILDDWEEVHLFLSDPEVMRWTYLGPQPYTPAQSRLWIESHIYHNNAVPRFSHNSVLVERQSGQILGWIGIGEPNDTTLGDLDFGYALTRLYWGKGYMTEALKGVLKFAFEQLEANVVFGECKTVNTGSYRVMEKAGMQRSHLFVETPHPLAEPIPYYHYTISRELWKAQNLALL